MANFHVDNAEISLFVNTVFSLLLSVNYYYFYIPEKGQYSNARTKIREAAGVASRLLLPRPQLRRRRGVGSGRSVGHGA